MKLLAIDTATEACSAALLSDGEIIENFQIAPRQHTTLILPMIDRLLADAQLQPQQLDALAFGCGPGSFTGVRIATGVIQGIAFGADLPVAPVSTLASLALQGFDSGDADYAFAAMDARMQEIYWGVYRRDDSNLVVLQGLETVGAASEVDAPGVKGIGVGSGWQVYRDQLSARMPGQVDCVQAELLPRAGVIARLAKTMAENRQLVPVEQAMPVYLRDNVAKKSNSR